MRIVDDVKLDFSDVLIVPKRSTLSSRKDVVIEREFKFRNSQLPYKGVPVMAANMDGVGTLDMALSLSKNGMFTALVKHLEPDQIFRYMSVLKSQEGMDVARAFYENVAISTGTSKQDFDKLELIMTGDNNFKYICIDVANGYSEHFIEFCKMVRARFPYKVLIAGNVVTPDITEELILNGIDIVKVGIGPGSVCTTRKQTGVGYPQLSAIIECSDAAHGLGGHIIADGGCTCPGDVVKAFGAGADFVMCGGMLAGHTQGGGRVIPGDRAGVQYVEFYGMSSQDAMMKHHGEVANYRSSEGKTVRIPYRGEVQNTINDILGGLRSGMTYMGARTLKEVGRRTTFIRVNNQLNKIYGDSNG